jgi:hypothetical protein
MQDIWQRAGLQEIETQVIRIPIAFASFDEFWETISLPIGPQGMMIQKMSPNVREPGASARTTDIPRPRLLAVSAKRRVSASPAAISPPPPARISSRKTSRAGARRPDAPSSKSPQLVMRN